LEAGSVQFSLCVDIASEMQKQIMNVTMQAAKTWNAKLTVD